MPAREPRARPPALERYSDEPLFNTKAVARQTGVPAPTLRAWERRYGILAPQRGENAYRLYSERDMALVSWLRERVESGMTISQAIALLRTLEAPPSYEAMPLTAGRLALTATAPKDDASLALSQLAGALLERLMSVREQAAVEIIAQALALYSVRDACLSLFTPVLEEVGRLWEAGEIASTTEHFAAGVIRRQLDGLFRCAVDAEIGPSLVVGCAPGELHEVGPLMLALFLRRRGFHVIYLGQSVEAASVARMAATIDAAGVVLSAAMEAHAEGLRVVGEHLAHERRMARNARRTVLYFGGQAFAQRPALAGEIDGQYLSMNACDAAAEIHRRAST